MSKKLLLQAHRTFLTAIQCARHADDPVQGLMHVTDALENWVNEQIEAVECDDDVHAD